MGWLESILGGLGTGLLGTIASPLIGSWVKGKEHDRKMIEMRFQGEQDLKNGELDLKRQQLDLQMTKIEAESAEKRAVINTEAQITKAEIEAESKLQESDAETLQAAIKAESKLSSGSPWVDAVRALNRPILTWVLTLFVGAMWIMAYLTGNQALLEALTQAAITIWIACMTFWFGGRAISHSIEGLSARRR